MTINKLTNNIDSIDQIDKINEVIEGKQDTLVSGTNIKTINNNSILGTGNITINTELLPSQSGQSGKFLTTDGSNASWANVDALPSQTGQSGKYLTTNGTSASWGTITVPSKISDLTDDTSTNPIDKADTLTNLTATVAELNVLDGITATTTELNYIDGVTSSIQNQLNAKANDNAVVKLTGNQTVAGVKTFTGNPVFQSDNNQNIINIKYTGDTGSYITFSNSTETLGYIGLRADGLPLYDATNYAGVLVRSTLESSSATIPVYIDEHGIAQTITSYSGTSDKAIKDGSGNVITTTYQVKATYNSTDEELVL